MDGKFTVDWERRRVMADGNSTHCCHGSRLTEFCGDCGLDLEVLAADRVAASVACSERRDISGNDVYGAVDTTGEAA